MSEMRGLGKGIRALIPERSLTSLVEGPDQNKDQVVRIPLTAIRPSRFQPRQRLDESEIQKLADSIRESGLIYPLLVRKTANSGTNGPQYELIAGERRFRALRLLGESETPVIIKEVDDRKAFELSLIENIQRQELNPIEEALAYQRLMQEFGLTHEQISTAVGKDRSTVANAIRLLKLPSAVREEVIRGTLTLGHARALLALESERSQIQLVRQIVADGLSVRRVEQLVKTLIPGESRVRIRSRATQAPHLAAAPKRMQRALGTKEEIPHWRSRGWIRVAYYSVKDLNRLLDRLAGP